MTIANTLRLNDAKLKLTQYLEMAIANTSRLYDAQYLEMRIANITRYTVQQEFIVSVTKTVSTRFWS